MKLQGLRRIKFARYIARKIKIRNTYKILVAESEGRTPLARQTYV